LATDMMDQLTQGLTDFKVGDNVFTNKSLYKAEST